jgi:alpha-N-arabinofuranosidase
MRGVDPTIHILACGAQLLGLQSEWNRRLIDECGDILHTITDHLLTGGPIGPNTDPVELYHAFMGYASTLDDLYRPMIERMKARGVEDPHIAITELQLFARWSGQPRPGNRLRPEGMPTPATISEALYLMTLIHAFIRMQGTVEMLTHSATVNHGGGLRKTRERVWANPVHYAHQMAAALSGGTPLKVRVACGTFSTTHSFGTIPAHKAIPVLDTMAVLSEDHSRLIVSLVNRSAEDEPVNVVIVPDNLQVDPNVHMVTLAGEAMYDQNTESEPARIVPCAATVEVQNGEVRLSIAPYSLLRLTFDLVPS